MSTQVAFMSLEGTVVMIHKHKRRRYVDENDRDIACIEIIKRLKDHGVKPSTVNTLKLGLGAQTLYAYKRKWNLLKFKRQKKDDSL